MRAILSCRSGSRCCGLVPVASLLVSGTVATLQQVNVDAFIGSYTSLWEGDPRFADHPRDRRFGAIIEATGGMATENKLALLQHAASHLDAGEAYLEIGTYRGTSVIGAALDSGSDTRFIAIDDFSQFDGPEQACRDNIRRFNPKIRLLTSDGFAVLRGGGLEARIGVYFYDGGHTFWEQWHALQLVEPHLADEAVILIDDASHPPVAAANREWLRLNPRFTRIDRFPSPRNGEPRWWNGVDLLAYRRAGRSGRPPDRRVRAVGACLGTPYEFIHNTVLGAAGQLVCALRRRASSPPGSRRDATAVLERRRTRDPGSP